MPEVQESVLGQAAQETLTPKQRYDAAYYRRNRERILARVKYSAGRHDPIKTSAYHRAYRAKHRAKALAYAAEYRKQHPDRWYGAEIKARYGVSLEQYAAMLKSQNGRCKICRTNTLSVRFKRFSIDHCHDTGKVRGLLCNNCNAALGLFKHDPARLLDAVTYLKGCGFLDKEKPQTS